MELIKKVKRIEVKRCFVFSQRFTSKKMRKAEVKNYITKPTKETFSRNLTANKKEVLKLKEVKLDKIIFAEYPKRLKAYDSVEWYIGYVDADEIGLWKEAGGLPKSWTRGSLKGSADKLSNEIRKNNSKYSRIRAYKVVPEIIEFKSIIKKEKYLLPIVLPGGTNASCRRNMLRMEGDIDDGCMRSLAFVISGDRKIKAYIGVKVE